MSPLVEESRRTALELAALPTGWGRLLALVALVAIWLLVFWLYRREARRGAGPRLRVALAVLRCVVLTLVALVLLRPVLATYVEHTTAAQLFVLGGALRARPGGLATDVDDRGAPSHVAWGRLVDRRHDDLDRGELAQPFDDAAAEAAAQPTHVHPARPVR